MSILDCIKWRVGLVHFKPPAILFLLPAKARQPKGEPFPIMPSAIGKVKMDLILLGAKF